LFRVAQMMYALPGQNLPFFVDNDLKKPKLLARHGINAKKRVHDHAIEQCKKSILQQGVVCASPTTIGAIAVPSQERVVDQDGIEIDGATKYLVVSGGMLLDAIYETLLDENEQDNPHVQYLLRTGFPAGMLLHHRTPSDVLDYFMSYANAFNSIPIRAVPI